MVKVEKYTQTLSD